MAKPIPKNTDKFLFVVTVKTSQTMNHIVVRSYIERALRRYKEDQDNQGAFENVGVTEFNVTQVPLKEDKEAALIATVKLVRSVSEALDKLPTSWTYSPVYPDRGKKQNGWILGDPTA